MELKEIRILGRSESVNRGGNSSRYTGSLLVQSKPGSGKKNLGHPLLFPVPPQGNQLNPIYTENQVSNNPNYETFKLMFSEILVMLSAV